MTTAATLDRPAGALPRQWREHRGLSQLDLPLRDRNQLLLAAGYAPVYSQDALDSLRLAAVRTAVRHVLTLHGGRDRMLRADARPR